MSNSSESSKGNFRIRPAVIDDCDEIMKLIVELAVYQKMGDRVKIDAETLRKDFFGETPRCQAIVAELAEGDSKKLIAYALFYNTYSTWEGLTMHLEDLYVRPEYRSSGLASLIWKKITKIALDMGCSRSQFTVLGWNKSKDWYERIGCVDITKKEDWHLMKMRVPEMNKFVEAQQF